MTVRAPERDALTGCAVTALGLAHRGGTHPAPPDRVATCHRALPVSDLVLQDQSHGDDRRRPDDSDENRDPVEVLLDHRRTREGRRDATAEQVRQTAAL